MIYSSKIAELNRKHAEDMNEFSPGMQEYSTSSIWNYVEENFKTACKIVGNCQKLIGTMMVDLERFLGSDFCPTKLKGSKQLLLLVQNGLLTSSTNCLAKITILTILIDVIKSLLQLWQGLGRIL